MEDCDPESGGLLFLAGVEIIAREQNVIKNQISFLLSVVLSIILFLFQFYSKEKTH